jgi:hypothetical protein
MLSHAFLLSGMLGSSRLKMALWYLVIFWTIFVWWFLILFHSVMNIHQKAYIWLAFDACGIESSDANSGPSLKIM